MTGTAAIIPCPRTTRASSFHIRLATPLEDNGQLCALSEACPQGEGLRFYYARTDHWERCRLFPDAQVFVAERGETVIGAATVGFKSMWLLGSLRPVAYLFDRMVRPDYRRQGVARALLRRQLDAGQNSCLQYCLVLEDNHANRGLLEREGFRAHPRRLLYFTILPGLFARRLPRGFQFREPVDDEHGAVVDGDFRRRYGFCDVTAASGDSFFQLSGAAGAIVYRHGPKVFSHAPWYYRWLGKLSSVVPPLHTPVHSWSLCHLHSRDGQALADLLAGIAWVAHASGVAMLLLPLYEHDPQINDVRSHTVNRWNVAPTRVCLYLHGDMASALLRCDQPFLASGRDG